MKVIIFDFDGTITEKKGNLWKAIWRDLGYSVGPRSYYMRLLNRFLSGKLSYDDWCDLTLEAFKKKGFNSKKLNETSSYMTLMKGAKQLIKKLYDKGYELHIVSGNIVSVIKKMLSSSVKYFTKINANEFVFDKSGDILKIVGTKYDCEGKALYIKELCAKMGYDPSDILFVGNSLNDEWVYLSGAKTICVNPDNTKSF